MNLNIRTKLAINEDTELVSVGAYTVFEVGGYKFFSHCPVDNEFITIPDRWKVSEYSTGMAITWNDFHTEDEAIEAAKKIISKRPDLAHDISVGIEQYGIANEGSCQMCGDSKTTKKGICKKCRKEMISDRKPVHFYEY